MSNAPFMPKATAVWLVENTTLSFKQIANFCQLHELEVKGIWMTRQVELCPTTNRPSRLFKPPGWHGTHSALASWVALAGRCWRSWSDLGARCLMSWSVLGAHWRLRQAGLGARRWTSWADLGPDVLKSWSDPV